MQTKTRSGFLDVVLRKNGRVVVSKTYESQHQHGAIDRTGGFQDFLFSP